MKHIKLYEQFLTENKENVPMPEELKKKIKDKNLPDGFSVGKDEKGYYIYTHRARSKSHEDPGKITVKEIKFIDSTG